MGDVKMKTQLALNKKIEYESIVRISDYWPAGGVPTNIQLLIR